MLGFREGIRPDDSAAISGVGYVSKAEAAETADR